MMFRILKTRLMALLALAALAAAAAVPAGPARAQLMDAEELVIQAEFTAKRMWDHKEFGEYVRAYMRRAKAVVIVPQMLKGGFFIGGEGGSGVLLARGDGNRWSYPSFLAVGSASFGLQFGGQSSQLMLLVMTGKGLEAILDDKVQLGGEINGAVGPYGAGAEATTTTNLDADVIAYSIAKGAFIGINIEGTALIPRDSLNQEYYGTPVTPRQVVLEGSVGNPQADGLRATLQRLVSQ